MEGMIRRDAVLNRLIAKKHNGMVKVITGLRRCGKSYLLFHLFRDRLLESGVAEDHILTVALDDDTQAEYRDPEKLSRYIRSRIVDGDRYYILLDEIQMAISRDEMKKKEDIRLYSVLNGLLRLNNTDIYVTGSNSKMLTKDVLSVFRGRGDEVRVHPLSFREYYDFVGGGKAEAYENYAYFGGMPQTLYMKDDAEKTAYLKNLFAMVYFTDITERYHIELPDLLEGLTDDLCSSVGSLTNASKIANTLCSVRGIKVSSSTVAGYLEHLEESFLFQQAKRYDVKGRKYFEYPSKYYAGDVGLRNARLNFRQQEETHIMENIIFNTLVQRGFAVDVGMVELIRSENGKRSTRQCEIDFVASMGSKKYYIQSALNVGDPQKLETELRPLNSTGDSFRKVLITKTHARPWTDEKGVLRLGLYDFLLDDEALRF